MSIEKTEAIIINSIDWSDTSKILSFYTRENGRVKAIAKGARRTNSRFRGALELFYYVDLVYYEKDSRELQTVSQCSVRKDFQAVKQDLVKTAYCSYFAQIAGEISGEKQKCSQIFQLLLDIFDYLEENTPDGLLARYFELNLLKASGYGPVLKNCGACGRKLQIPAERAGFSPGAGGALCESCMDSIKYFMMLSGGTLSTLACLDRIALGMLGRIKASKQIKDELKEALSCYLDYHLEKKLKSRDFLEEILKNERQ
jgi:DNA repair protein RecO (recombination protein O)